MNYKPTSARTIVRLPIAVTSGEARRLAAQLIASAIRADANEPAPAPRRGVPTVVITAGDPMPAGAARKARR